MDPRFLLTDDRRVTLRTLTLLLLGNRSTMRLCFRNLEVVSSLCGDRFQDRCISAVMFDFPDVDARQLSPEFSRMSDVNEKITISKTFHRMHEE